MSLLNLGIIAGAFTAASLASEFKLRVPKQPLRYVQSIGGGILMGYGVDLALGCPVGGVLLGDPVAGVERLGLCRSPCNRCLRRSEGFKSPAIVKTAVPVPPG
jgi:Sulphur transport